MQYVWVNAGRCGGGEGRGAAGAGKKIGVIGMSEAVWCTSQKQRVFSCTWC